MRVLFVLTGSVLLHLPERPQQLDVAFVAFVVLRVEQDLLGVDEQARDAGQKEGQSGETRRIQRVRCPLRGVGCTHIESLKFPTNPGLSPGVGLRKQGLLALQMMPWTQGNIPAEGMALLGK